MKNLVSKITQPLLKIVCLCLIINLLSQKANCQLLTSDNVTVTVLAATQVTVEGDVLNQNAATISNNGTIDLSGNWIHNAANNCFGTSIGTVILSGPNQTIGGSNTTLFNNLTLDGSGTKTLLINTTVGGNAGGGILDIGKRNLILNSKTMFLNNSSTGAIAFNNNGFITSEQTNNSSKIIWSINSTVGAHIIPFGTALGVQIPFTYNLTAGNAGNVTVSTYPTPANNLPLPVTPLAVTHIRNNAGVDNSANTVNRFWEVDNTGTTTAALTFTWASTENAANGNSNPRAQRWIAPAVAWQTPLAGQTNPTTQSVTVPNVTYNSFGPWAVSLSTSPLPIQLISFEAQAVDNKKVLCEWITATEINNDYFTVERSANGQDFEETGIVDGAGNSNSILNYNFTDENPFSGVSYYRLKQTDFNGQFTYSNVVSVTIKKSFNTQASIYPNPAHNNFTTAFNFDFEQPVLLQVYDMAGRKVLTENFIATEGVNSRKTDVSQIANGVYIVEITSGETKEQIRFVKN